MFLEDFFESQITLPQTPLSDTIWLQLCTELEKPQKRKVLALIDDKNAAIEQACLTNYRLGFSAALQLLVGCLLPCN